MTPKCLPFGQGFHWRVRARCDWEEMFTTDTFDYYFDTTDIELVAQRVKEIIGSNHTIFSIERMD